MNKTIIGAVALTASLAGTSPAPAGANACDNRVNNTFETELPDAVWRARGRMEWYIPVGTQAAWEIFATGAFSDDLDRVYDEQQVEEMADIAVQILVRSEYPPRALLDFWKRVAADDDLERRVKRLSRRITPEERVAVLETVMQGMPATEPVAAGGPDGRGTPASL